MVFTEEFAPISVRLLSLKTTTLLGFLYDISGFMSLLLGELSEEIPEWH